MVRMIEGTIIDGIVNNSFEDLNYMDRGVLTQFSSKRDRKAYDFLRGNQLGSTTDAVDYWAGPLLPSSHSEYSRMLDALKSSFTSRNMVLEVCERAVDGVLSDEPSWTIEGIPDTTLVEEALTRWSDRRRLSPLLWSWAVSMVAMGRSTLRFVIPQRFRADDGTLNSASNIDEALDMIYIINPSPLDAAVVTDTSTLQDIGVYVYTNRQQEELEITYVDEAGLTVLKIMSQAASAEVRLPLGGLLWHVQGMLNRGLVTPDMIQQQSAMNVAMTMMQRNTHYAGFVERYGIGLEAYNEDGTPIKPVTGPGAINFFQPSVFEEVTTDEVGSIKTSQKAVPAQYGRFEPSSVDPMKVAIDISERAILSIARQGFVMMSDVANTSGRSREVAAGDYLNMEHRIASEVEGAYRSVLEFALRLAGEIMGTNKYLSARAVVSCGVTAFSPTPEEQKVNISNYQAGLISLETAMTRAGVDDTDAERARMEEEKSIAEVAATVPPILL